MWDARYSEDGFAYGKEANDFLKDQIQHVIGAGKALCLAEGQGRNAVYLAKLGYEVTAVDLSPVGLETAQKLATDEGVSIATEVCDLATWPLGERQWDLIVSIWAHMPSEVRSQLHARVASALKTEGLFVLEAYTPANLGRGTGGPPNQDMLMTLEILETELGSLKTLFAQETERNIEEGRYHKGLSAVVQFVGKKVN
ncbi:class I SAM-dependent methyltransferase [Pseudobacteriovorax antillogorgiicola]|uniref:Methyltransferase domain-containing protein n=1 Tax=Pseudobacteriovorax antillogorgiicola TaxID=1513793 RepID=A0A1Y6C145_9BACT|nr:class I SAM-dependent methyltransferase [Pseudobacteriovorax antillogorgiicola]TCS52264.1 methyltransferase family protein [Pseudobacteriovorax antillogorgiicola]SMF30953.1 Methyltransferase domain-containing protein [Pseudobacteriovorax antillogorgiicola]